MSDFTLSIKIFDYWHCGTGGRGSGDVDAEPVTEACGLPYIPGKHLKGLLREAARFAAKEGFISNSDLENRWFGGRTEDADGRNLDAGKIVVRNGLLKSPFAESWRASGKSGPELPALFTTLRQTALKNGMALDKTLRSMRAVVPATLEARVSIPDEEGAADILETLCKLIRAVGHARNDGLGRCTVTCKPAETSEEAPGAEADLATIIPSGACLVDIELSENVILSTSTATTGGHESHDHIPGSTLWGVAASAVYGSLKPDSDRLHAFFHSGRLRFGNAYPVHPEGTAPSNSPVPAPLSWHSAKGSDSEQYHDLATQSVEDAMGSQQPVQLRGGYLAKDQDGPSFLVRPTHGHVLKTAIHAKSGNAAEGQLFGFSFIPAGWRFTARLEWDDDLAASEADTLGKILSLFNKREIRLGRSRSAEFGGAWACIRPASDIESPTPGCSALALSDIVLPVGAGSGDLLALLPKLLDNPDAQIVTKKTFIRTRRYSPWNAYRHCPDPERILLCKGSVITFNTAPQQPPARIGVHQTEGFGHIAWSLPAPPEKLKSINTLREKQKTGKLGDDPFSKWLYARYNHKAFDAQALEIGQRLAAGWGSFHASLTASQWSRLRTLATECTSWEKLKVGLDGTKGLFTHGRMADKWKKEKGRGRCLHKAILEDLGALVSVKPEALVLAACREASRLLASEAQKQDQ